MKTKSLIAILLLVMTMAACKKSFTDRPSLDGTTLENYYNTAEEVRGLTSTLYGLPWSGFENRAMDAIGDVMPILAVPMIPRSSIFLLLPHP